MGQECNPKVNCYILSNDVPEAPPQVIMGQRCNKEGDCYVLSNGTRLDADLVYACRGDQPKSSLRELMPLSKYLVAHVSVFFTISGHPKAK